MSAAVALAALGGALLAAGGHPASATVRSGPVQAAASVTLAQSPSLTREQRLARLVNAERTKRGLKPYVVSAALSSVAEEQARRMTQQRRLFHNPNLTTDVRSWRAIGENVAYTSTVSRAHALLMNSPGHRANILSTTFTQVGLGVVKDSQGTVWVVEVFRKPA